MALLNVVDEIISQSSAVKQAIELETQIALDKFYVNNGPTNALASEILAHLQAISAMISEPLLSSASIETFVREREHFRLRRAHNERSARAMRKHRNGSIIS
jgi:hypothetical protein